MLVKGATGRLYSFDNADATMKSHVIWFYFANVVMKEVLCCRQDLRLYTVDVVMKEFYIGDRIYGFILLV